MLVRINMLENAKDLPAPVYATEESAGMDLLSSEDEEIILSPGQRRLVSCGFCMELPQGYEAQIRPRSGFSFKNGITVLNSPGTIDSDYRGEIKALLINLGEENFTITRGMRIAQMVIAPVSRVTFVKTDDLLTDSSRASGGFGSTGTHAA